MLTKEKCRYADRYKAIFPPKCGPCKQCAAKWRRKQQEKKEKRDE